MTDAKANKLSIYLIKDDVDDKQILKKQEELDSVAITLDSVGEDSVGEILEGTMYYKASYTRTPPWLKKFFRDQFHNEDENGRAIIKSSTAMAVYIVKIRIGKAEKRFALCFGYGWSMLDPIAYEERFGLRVILNSMDADEIRALDKKKMSANLKIAKEQISKFGNFSDFNVNKIQDLLRGVTARIKDELEENFGKTAIGKDSFSLYVGADIHNLNSLLVKCYEMYLSDDYKEKHSWVDNIKEISKSTKKLNNLMLERLREENFEEIWMTIPELIDDWERFGKFKYKNISLGLDMDIEVIFNKIADDMNIKEITIDDLRKLKIDAFDTDGNKIKDWPILKCLYYEIKENTNNNFFILTEGKWYQIDDKYAKDIEENFEVVHEKGMPDGIKLPVCGANMDEKEYNEKAGKEPNFFCLDRKNITPTNANDQIETCDLIYKKNLIHVKVYRYSTSLSHLFSQGYVSADILKNDAEFRKQVNEKIDGAGIESYITEDSLDPTKYNIIYAIIKDEDKDFNLPFFSMVNFKFARRNLENMGYNVFITKIDKKVI